MDSASSESSSASAFSTGSQKKKSPTPLLQKELYVHTTNITSKIDGLQDFLVRTKTEIQKALNDGETEKVRKYNKVLCVVPLRFAKFKENVDVANAIFEDIMKLVRSADASHNSQLNPQERNSSTGSGIGENRPAPTAGSTTTNTPNPQKRNIMALPDCLSSSPKILRRGSDLYDQQIQSQYDVVNSATDYTGSMSGSHDSSVVPSCQNQTQNSIPSVHTLCASKSVQSNPSNLSNWDNNLDSNQILNQYVANQSN